MKNNSNLITVIVPVFNEEKTIIDVLNKIKKIKFVNFSLETIVVNDGSTDKTKEKLEQNLDLYDKCITNSVNKGKGYSVKKALEIANGTYIIFQDADLEYDPNDFIKFFNVIEKFEPDLIIGSRLNYSEYTRSHNIFNKFGNMLITLFFNMLYNTTFTDIYSCYVCFKKNLLDYNSLRTDGFQQQAEILCKIVRKGRKFFEVPINYNGRTHDEGKKIKFYHIFGVLYCILVGKFNS